MAAMHLNEAADRLADVLVDFPELGERLLKTMDVQRRIDPQAGMGAMHGILQFFHLQLTEERTVRLFEMTANEYELYVVTRGMDFSALSPEQLEYLLDHKLDFQFATMAKVIAKHVPLFNADLAIQFCR